MRKRKAAAAVLACAACGLVAATGAFGFGVFGSPTSFPVEVGYQVAIGDVNGDGKADVVASNDGPGGNGFVLAKGNGDGSFKPSSLIPDSRDGTEGLAIGKFNGDRRNDVAVSSYLDDSVAMFFGNKGGGFTAGPIFVSGPGATELRTGDFNEDGLTDLVACNYSSTGPRAISVLLRKKGGGFTDRDFGGLSDCRGIDVGHLNKDKHLDVVEQSEDGPFAVFLGKGNGFFKPHTDHLTLSANDAYDNVAIGDFTGDGRDDVAAVSYGQQKLLVYPGNASGSLGSPKKTSLDFGPQGIEAADFNRDGKLDLALGGYIPQHLSVLFGKGDGKFKSNPHTAPQSEYSYSVAVGRLNRDKAPDIVVGTGTTADIYINGNP